MNRLADRYFEKSLSIYYSPRTEKDEACMVVFELRTDCSIKVVNSLFGEQATNIYETLTKDYRG